MLRRSSSRIFRIENLEQRDLLTVVSYPFAGTGVSSQTHESVEIRGEFRFDNNAVLSGGTDGGEFALSLFASHQDSYRTYEGYAFSQWFTVSGGEGITLPLPPDTYAAYRLDQLWFDFFDGSGSLAIDSAGQLPHPLSELFGVDAHYLYEEHISYEDGHRYDYEIEGKVRLLYTDLISDLKWDDSGNLVVSYQVLYGEVDSTTDLRLYWGNDQGTIGGPIQEYSIPAGTQANDNTPYLVATLSPAQLGLPPVDATHLIAVADEEDIVYREKRSDNNRTSLSIRDSVPTSLSWDATGGGIRLAYNNKADIPENQSPTFNLYWINDAGEKLSGPLVTGGNEMARAKGAHSEFVTGLAAAPPAGTTKLLLVVDDGNRFVELNEQNNERTLAYEAEIDSVLAEFDGTGPDDHIIGRFFTAGQPISQKITVNVSDALAALRSELVMTVGGVEIVANWVNGTTYVMPAFDPGTFDGDTPISIRSNIANSPQGLTWFGTLDMEPLPKWYNCSIPRPTFDPTTHRYNFAGDLVNIDTGALLKILSTAKNPIWFGANESLGSLKAKIHLDVTATLNVSDEPEVIPTLELLVQGLPGDDFHRKLAADEAGHFTSSIDLDGRKLNIQSATARYQETVALSSVGLSLFGGKSFQSDWFKAVSQVTIVPTLVTDLNLTFNADGRLAANSYADAKLSGTLGGKLTDLTLDPFAARNPILTVLQRASTLARVSPPALLVNAISSLLSNLGVLPSFPADLNVSGTINLSGRAMLSPTGTASLTIGGDIDLSVTGNVAMTWLGQTTIIAGLPSLFNDKFKIRKSWS